MRKLSLIFAFALVCATAWSQAVTSLCLPSDPEELSLGSFNYNRYETRKTSISASHFVPGKVDNKYASLDFSTYVKNFSFGLDAYAYQGKPYITSSSVGKPGKEAVPMDASVAVSLSGRMFGCLSVGVSGRVVYSTLGNDYTGYAASADLNVEYVSEKVVLGVAACNIGSAISYYPGFSSSLPALVKAGGFYQPFPWAKIGVEGDYILGNGAWMVTAGAEFTLLRFLALRGGYHYASNVMNGGVAVSAPVPTYATLGAGLKLGSHVELAANYITASEMFDGTLTFGVMFRF